MQDNNIIILRNVYKLPKLTVEPSIDPSTGRYPSTVRRVNSQGDMILSDEDRKSNKHFIAENERIEIFDGKTFRLDDEVDAAWWEAIKYSKKITQDRWTKDHKGDFIIDGDTRRYGTAEFYIERPGVETQSRNNNKRAIHEATQHIYKDSLEGLYMKARLLNNPMNGMPASDVEDFLVGLATKNPDKIKEVYTGSDTHLRILLIDSIDKRVIRVRDKIYIYGDNVMLGGSEDSVLLWLKNPENGRLVELIKRETYPDLYISADVVTDAGSQTPISKPKTK